ADPELEPGPELSPSVSRGGNRVEPIAGALGPTPAVRPCSAPLSSRGRRRTRSNLCRVRGGHGARAPRRIRRSPKSVPETTDAACVPASGQPDGRSVAPPLRRPDQSDARELTRVATYPLRAAAATESTPCNGDRYPASPRGTPRTGRAASAAH